MSRNDDDRELLARLDALPREIRPAADLWPGIAERIAAGEARRARAKRARWIACGALAAALAAAAVAVVASRHVAPAPLASRIGARMAIPSLPAARPGEQAYVEAAAALERAFDEQRALLPEETARAVDASLAALHAAIATTRAALDESPDDEALVGALFDAYQQEIDALDAVLDSVKRT